MEIHRSAHRHGVTAQDLRHAVANALAWVDLDAETDPPKVLAIGPDRAGNLLEVVILELSGGRWLAIHAMSLRPFFHPLLPPGSRP